MQMRSLQLLLTGCLLVCALFVQAAQPEAPTVTRLTDGPIIVPNMDARMGSNIQGPSLIRVPEWIDDPLGNYYLYFADHRGTYIRLAYADEITGPTASPHFWPDAAFVAVPFMAKRRQTQSWCRRSLL